MPALTEVITAHRGYVRALLARHHVPRDRLDDAEQEVFLVLVRRRDDYDPRFSHRRWLSGIVRNVAAAEHRRSRRGVGSYLHRVDPTGAERFDAALDARALLRSLDEPQREVWLAAEIGHTAKEIAERLSLPLTTVQWRLRDARRRLREAVRAAGHRCRALWLGWRRELGRFQRTAAPSALAFSTLAACLFVHTPPVTHGPPTRPQSALPSASAVRHRSPPPPPRPYAHAPNPIPPPAVPDVIARVRAGPPDIEHARRPRGRVHVGEPTIKKPESQRPR
jgi:RNA polymerase sigma-70 factor (ECF subfamily)